MGHPQPRTPGLSDTILTALVEARRLRSGPVPVEALAREAYGRDRPTEYLASIRCAVQRLRADGRTIRCVSGHYWLTDSAAPPGSLKARSTTILGRIRAQSWQRRAAR